MNPAPISIEIEPNARTIIAGKTGSGKTFLAKHILKGVPRLVVIDTKNNLREDMNLKPEINRNWRDLRLGLPIRLQIKPPFLPTSQFAEYYDGIFRKVFYAADCVVYIDELYSVTQGAQTLSTYLTALYTRGREPVIGNRGRIVGGNIGIIACTQRPANIPVFCMTESEHFFVFQLQNPDDRLKLANYTSPEIKEPIKDEHGFYYYQTRATSPLYIQEL